MMSSSYVWIATDWLSAVTDSSLPGTPDVMGLTQGVLVLRQHIPDSGNTKNALLSKRNNLTRNGSLTLSSYTMHAYDFVWLVARAAEQFLSEGNSISFSMNPNLQDIKGSMLCAV
jgi:glutamate receptor, ionotropic, plant